MFWRRDSLRVQVHKGPRIMSIREVQGLKELRHQLHVIDLIKINLFHKEVVDPGVELVNRRVKTVVPIQFGVSTIHQ